MATETGPAPARARAHRRRRAVAVAGLIIAALGAAALVDVGGSPAPAAATGVSHRDRWGGTTGWRLARRVDLTREPAGTAYTTGVRTNTDQSVNRRSQARFGRHGLTVTARRIDGRIYSADVMLRGVNVPPVGAVEVRVDLEGTGPGVGHAVWFRPLSPGANGEMDLLEYIGSNSGRGIRGGPGRYESKSTLIRTGTSPYNLGSQAFGIRPRAHGSYDGMRRYRYEFTRRSASLWVDGAFAGRITRAAFQRTNGAGSWRQFASGTHWYPRVTLQVNNGTTAKLWGFVPRSWTTSSIRVATMRIYKRR